MYQLSWGSFNPRAHEGRDFSPYLISANFSCFNPRAHEGRDKAPLDCTRCQECFNPRAHEGRDFAALPSILKAASFNPRAHEGRDIHNRQIRLRTIVSIHAPTRGATYGVVRLAPGRKFQSTRPRGARLRRLHDHRRRNSFNPRAHEGRDRAFINYNEISVNKHCFREDSVKLSKNYNKNKSPDLNIIPISILQRPRTCLKNHVRLWFAEDKSHN